MISNAIRAFLEEPHLCIMATLNRDGSPHLTPMWFQLAGDLVVLNLARNLVKERNLRRDARMAICVADGARYVTLSGRADIVEDRVIQEVEVNRMGVRYHGARLGERHWDTIAHEDRLGLHMRIERMHSFGFDSEGRDATD